MKKLALVFLLASVLAHAAEGTFRVVLVVAGDQGSQFINAVVHQQFWGDNRAGWDPDQYYQITPDYARYPAVYSVDIPAIRSSVQMAFNFGDSSGWQQTVFSDANIKSGGIVYVIKGPHGWGTPYNRSSVVAASGGTFDPLNQDAFPGLPSSTEISGGGGSGGGSGTIPETLDAAQFAAGFAAGLLLFGSWLIYYGMRRAGDEVSES